MRLNVSLAYPGTSLREVPGQVKIGLPLSPLPVGEGNLELLP